MKKLGISVILILMLMFPATMYVQAYKVDHQVNDYLVFIEHFLTEKQEKAEQTLSAEIKQSTDTGKKELSEFYLDKLFGVKKNVEQHQQDYLFQLKETVDVLRERDLKEYEEKKAEELRNEIGQDVENYLEEILSDK
ncbi:hypothetical protein [Virgibacillus kimchii]